MTAQHLIIIVSALGGVIGGMGMGGGTLLIPLLTMCAGIEQHLAQAINLISFVPMSLAALTIHGKNGYVEFGTALPVVAVSIAGAAAGSLLTKYAGGKILRASYGIFLIVLGAYQLAKIIVVAVKNKKRADVKRELGR